MDLPPLDDPELLAGRYRLGSLLGRGGMAEVYDGFDERLARPVAIKILRPAATEDTAMRTRFEREARSVARLSHPAVVAVYDSGEDRGRAYLVMERLPGETLADRIRQGPVDQRWLAPVLVDVLSALAAAHAFGMVHRDIKPANILLAADGRAKVADFGIAKVYQDNLAAGDQGLEDLTATGLILGTVAYLSPEQIGGAPASPQADIYAVGVVAYEALAGRKPFIGDNAIAQAHAVAEGRADDVVTGRPDVDPRLAAVVRRAMARRVEDRYQSAQAMLADVRATGLVSPGSAVTDTTFAMTGPDETMVWPRTTPITTVMPTPWHEPTRIDPAQPAVARPLRPEPPNPEASVAAVGGRPPDRRRRGLIAALTALAVIVVAAAVTAVLLSQSNSPRTIPPPSTTPTSVTPTSGAPAVTVPASSTTTSSTATTLPATTVPPSTGAPTTAPPTTVPPTTVPPTTVPPTTVPPTTLPPTTLPPTTVPPSTGAATTTPSTTASSTSAASAAAPSTPPTTGALTGRRGRHHGHPGG